MPQQQVDEAAQEHSARDPSGRNKRLDETAQRVEVSLAADDVGRVVRRAFHFVKLFRFRCGFVQLAAELEWNNFISAAVDEEFRAMDSIDLA